MTIAARAATAQALDAGEAALPDASADAAWESVKDLEDVRAELTRSGEPVAREEVIAAYVRRADALRDFRLAHATHPQVKEAERLEALALLHAGWAGDSSREERRHQVVADLRADLSIPAARRAELAAGAENLAVIRGFAGRQDVSRGERLAAYEAVARRPIAEFPEVPEGYEPLLQLARSQTDAEGARLVRELLALPAPDWLKAEAEAMRDRFALVGRSLAEVLGPDAPATLAAALSGDVAIVVYSWSAANPASLKLADRIARASAEGLTILALNLDGDPVAARAVAAERGLPGVPFFGAAEDGVLLAERLLLTAAPLVYLADGGGTIRTVSAHNSNIAEAINRVSGQ